MELDETVALLQKTGLFQGLSQDSLSLLVFSAERLLFRRGEPLYHNGESGEAAYLVLSGSVERINDKGVITRRRLVGRGALLGELAMLMEYTHGETAIAHEETEVLELPRQLVLQLMRQFPPIAEHFSQKIHARLFQLQEDLRRYDQRLRELEKKAG